MSSEWQDSDPNTAWRAGSPSHEKQERASKESNRAGVFEWEVLCTVTVFVRPQRFGWTVGDPHEPSSTWTYTLEATNGGAGAATTVTQTFEHGPGDSFVRRAVELAPPAANVITAARTRQLRHNMNTTLQQAEAQLMGTDRT
jgi:hypothetical protein